VAQVLDEDALDLQLVSEPNDLREFVEVPPHGHNHHPNPRGTGLQAAPSLNELFDVRHDAIKSRPHAYAFVGRGARAVERDMNLTQAARDAALGSPRIQKRRVGVRTDLNSTGDGDLDHVEEPRMHHRLAEPLELESLERGKLVEQFCKD